MFFPKKIWFICLKVTIIGVDNYNDEDGAVISLNNSCWTTSFLRMLTILLKHCCFDLFLIWLVLTMILSHAGWSKITTCPPSSVSWPTVVWQNPLETDQKPLDFTICWSLPWWNCLKTQWNMHLVFKTELWIHLNLGKYNETHTKPPFSFITPIYPPFLLVWWFGTCFPCIGNNNPMWLIFFRGVGILIPPTSPDFATSITILLKTSSFLSETSTIDETGPPSTPSFFLGPCNWVGCLIFGWWFLSMVARYHIL